jgi:predicted neuraminidase
MRIFLSGLCLSAALLIFPEVRGQKWAEVQLVRQDFVFSDPPFQQCHAPTLVETADGSILAAWFAGSYEGAPDVCIWNSVLRNGKWSVPASLVCGDSLEGNSSPLWNPVLFAPEDSTLILYYKLGNSPREWTGKIMVSKNSGISWSDPAGTGNILGPAKNKPMVTSSGTWLNPSSKESLERWQVFIERSEDQGKSWSIIPMDTSNPAKVIQPCLLRYPDGSLQALCRSNQDYIMESWSYDDGKSWNKLKRMGLPNPNSGIDALTLRSGIQLLVYNPLKSSKEWWNGRQKLSVAIASPEHKWEDIYVLEDQPSGEFSYPSVIETRNGEIHILYTYNRKSIKHVVLKIQRVLFNDYK